MPELTNARMYREAAESFATLVASIPEAFCSQPALGAWTVRDLVGHTNRSLRVVKDGLAQQTSQRPVIHSAVEYYIARRSLDPSKSVARAKAAGAALGCSPAQEVHDLVELVCNLVDEAPADVVISTHVGAMRLDDYLETRIFELTVHSLDLMAVARKPWGIGKQPLQMSLRLCADLAAAGELAPEVLLALTGRRHLPDGFTVL